MRFNTIFSDFLVCHLLGRSGECRLLCERILQKKGVDMNTFSGMFELWGMVFKFESKKLSLLMLVAAYGGAFMGIVILGLTLWGRSKGCDFPINDRSIR